MNFKYDETERDFTNCKSLIDAIQHRMLLLSAGFPVRTEKMRLKITGPLSDICNLESQNINGINIKKYPRDPNTHKVKKMIKSLFGLQQPNYEYSKYLIQNTNDKYMCDLGYCYYGKVKWIFHTKMPVQSE